MDLLLMALGLLVLVMALVWLMAMMTGPQRAVLIAMLMGMASAARADRSLVASTAAPGAYPTALTALTLTALDPANGNYIVLTGDENDLLVVQNTDSGSQTITVSSPADPITGRSGSITAESLSAGQIKIFGPPKLRGWAQPGGRLHFDSASALVKVGHVTLK